VNALLNEQLKSDFDRKNARRVRAFAPGTRCKIERKKLLPLEQHAQIKRPSIWSSYVPPKPEFWGVRVAKTVIPSGVEAATQPPKAASQAFEIRGADPR